jgi:thymidylate synthase (FAD)
MNLDGWRHFFTLRCSPAAHPDMKEVADMAKEMFATFVEDPTFFL